MNEKTSPSIVKLVAVLAVICIIVSAVLGGINMITYQRIEDIQTEKTNAAFNAVLPADGYTQLEGDFGNGISGIYEADTGHVVQLTIGGAQSNITLAVGVDNDGVVSGVSITLAPFSIPQNSTIAGYNASLVLDIPVMLLVMGLLTLPALFRGKLSRIQGIVLLLIYAAFCAVQFTL